MEGVGPVFLTRRSPLAALKNGETEAFKVLLLKGFRGSKTSIQVTFIMGFSLKLTPMVGCASAYK